MVINMPIKMQTTLCYVIAPLPRPDEVKDTYKKKSIE